MAFAVLALFTFYAIMWDLFTQCGIIGKTISILLSLAVASFIMGFVFWLFAEEKKADLTAEEVLKELQKTNHDKEER